MSAVPDRVYPPDFLLLLASRSPRRRELLQAAGIPHVVIHSHGAEVSNGHAPSLLAERNAEAKALGAEVPAAALAGAFVLGADTVVVADGCVLGKAATEAEAAGMLEKLSGRRHEVITGVCLARWDGEMVGRALVANAITTVEFRELDHDDIEAYLDSGEWRGKAGAYAIQGRAGLFATRIEGAYTNVVGLPLELLARLLREHGFDVLRRSWQSELRPVGRAGCGMNRQQV
jgi:septum formation protein